MSDINAVLHSDTPAPGAVVSVLLGWLLPLADTLDAIERASRLPKNDPELFYLRHTIRALPLSVSRVVALADTTSLEPALPVLLNELGLLATRLGRLAPMLANGPGGIPDAADVAALASHLTALSNAPSFAEALGGIAE